MESELHQAFTAAAGQDHRSRVAQARRTRTRSRILTAAIGVFVTQGRYGLVVEDFIRAAGVSRGTFYNYFRSVDELFEAASRMLEDDLMLSIESALAPLSDPVDRLATGVRLWLAKAAKDREWCAFVAQNDRRGTLVDESVMKDLRDGRALGAFRIPSIEAARDLLVGTVREAMVRMAAGGMPPGYANAIARSILGALGLDAAAVDARMSRPLPPMRRAVRTIIRPID
ncbi:MAG TPA: TetR/AcrR family transcriptional regulator [Steroidobacteraceae bacterium]|nr:TetR/AcrR family transcriptional regulator [Steroidobacteraceae bacterium]